MIQQALQRLIAREDLTRQEVEGVMAQIADGQATPAQVGAFLTLLRMKGETSEEIAGAAQVMRARVDRIETAGAQCVDTCGTGGDGQNTFNISTAAALVAAGAGAIVAKHGNRSVSSKCGSSDVLAALGVDVEARKETVERCLGSTGIAFLFAPHHHPAFKAVAALRRELGFRTLFNLLGPLANPAGARRQVMGVYERRWVPIVGRVLALLGAEHALVVHGEGQDEIALTGETLVCEVKHGEVREYTVRPEEVGLSRCAGADLAGGDATLNARILSDVLQGQHGAPRDAVVLNAAAALVVAGVATDLTDGVRRSAQAIDSGQARNKLRAVVELTRDAREQRG
ncbi:MAG: anthranilate phosphoribosyltransferase [Myxococcota bacterium]|nr:anthranilate phosphoribosyltransferase [Myxococcota bacterium]